MKRYVVMSIDEGWPTFYLTKDEALFDQANDVGKEDEEACMELMFGDAELYNKFDQRDDIVGVEVLGFVHFNTY